MSKYTTETRFICEQAAGYPESVGYERVDDVLDKSWDKIFNTAIQIFDEEYRPIICKKILKHYYTQEIGCETVGLWKLWMNRTFEEKIVYYNQLYESALLEFPVFQNVDYKMQSNKQGVGTTHNETVGNEQFQETQKWSGQDVTEKTGNDVTNTKQDTTTDNVGNVTDVTTGTVDTNKDTTGDVVDTESGTTRTQGTEDETDVIDTHTEDERQRNESSNDLKWDKYSDTPQGAVTGIEGTTDEDYWLTNATKDTDVYSGNSNESGNENGGSKETDNTVMDETVTHGKVVDKRTDMNEHTVQTSNETKTSDSTSNQTGNLNQDVTKNWSETDTTTYGKQIDTNSNKDTTGSADGKSETTEDYIQHQFGKWGYQTYAEMLQKFRDTFLNIDLMFISEFEDNFMQLW